MYSIYGIPDGGSPVCIYNDINLSGAANAIAPKLKLADNVSGSLDLTLPVGNNGYDLELMNTEIIVKRYNEEIWSGRILTEKTDFQNNRTLTCEGVLSYLIDTTQDPLNSSNQPRVFDTVPLYEFLEDILAKHNSKVKSRISSSSFKEIGVRGSPRQYIYIMRC